MNGKNKSNFGIIAFVIIVLLIVLLFWPNFLRLGNTLPVGRPNVGVDDINGVQDFSGTTVSFRIYNSGNAASENTRVTIEIYPEEGQILESKSIYVGRLNPGESKPMSTRMKSTNIKNGTFKVIPSQD